MPTISYKNLRKISPEAARVTVLDYLKSNPNISQAAKVFGVQRAVIYDILKRHSQGSLKDKSKAPKTVANKTAPEIGKKIIQAQKSTGFGAKRLSKYLREQHGVFLPSGTIRGILNRVK